MRYALLLFLSSIIVFTGCSATLSMGVKKDIYADGRSDSSPYQTEAMIVFKNDHFLEARR